MTHPPSLFWSPEFCKSRRSLILSYVVWRVASNAAPRLGIGGALRVRHATTLLGSRVSGDTPGLNVQDATVQESAPIAQRGLVPADGRTRQGELPSGFRRSGLTDEYARPEAGSVVANGAAAGNHL